jgi:membrane-associated phospholipid phosphatase
MKFLLCVMFLLPAFSQTLPRSDSPPADSGVATDAAAADQDQAPADQIQPSPYRSALKPAPGQQVIKPKDYQDSSGYFHPFTRMARFVLEDQKAIWTSPFHTQAKDVKFWLIFGGSTGALIGTDKYVSKNAPNNSTLHTLGSDVSYLGVAYTLLPITAGFYFGGTKFHDDHFRETGLASFEALADVTLVELVLKSVFDRQRPLEGHGNGEFEASTSPRYNSSFPSGHAIETFALASVVAHEYPHTLWVKVLAYSYAGGVVGARLAANQHFPGDVMAGGAIGWFVGDYVYGKRHNPELDKRPNFAQSVIDHVRLGGAFPVLPGSPYSPPGFGNAP